MTDTRQIVAEDRRLEDAESKAGGQLAAHRWHWTLDETNPERIGIREYARLVSRSDTTIGRYANGYAQYLTDARGTSAPSPVADHIERQSFSEERRAAAEAVADAHGISIGTVRQHHRDEVDQVTLAAAHEAETNPAATPDRRQEVMSRTAKNIVASRRIARQSRERLGKNTPALSILIDGELGKAHDGLIAALSYARQIDPDTFPKVFLDKINRSLDDIDALHKLVRTAIGGAADDINWDAELAKLSGGAS